MTSTTYAPPPSASGSAGSSASGSAVLPEESGRLPGVFRRFGSESAYLLLGFPMALVAFVLVVTGLAVGGGLLITVVGLPILTATMYVARGFAQAERWSVRRLLGHDVPAVRYRRAPEGATWFRRMFTPLVDGQSWLDILHALVSLVVATIAWAFAVTWWSAALGGLSYPIWGWAADRAGDADVPSFLRFGDSFAVKLAVYLVVGLLFAVTLPVVVRAFASLRGGLAHLLLFSRAESQRQVDELVTGRSAARSAEASALRRLERDIHDGPQQRLVRLSMDLGRARKQAGADNPQLQGTLDAALRQTQDTLEELRALSRGIAPPVLADRGLRAALEELGARSAVPIDLDISLPADRLAHHVETAVYFVASEALTNVAKHSGAEQCMLTVEMVGGDVRVRVSDDGRGGAHLSKGHGLVGLHDRVRAAEGVLNISSPDGGPTMVEAEIPCGS